MGKFKFAVLALFLALAVSGTAYAGSTSTTLNVSANVVVWCAIGVTDVDFGDYAGNFISVPLNVDVKCSNTAPWAVTMDAGQNYLNTFRHMTDGAGGLVRYNLIKPGGGEWSDVGYAGTYCCGTPVTGIGDGNVQGLAGSAIAFSGWAPAPGAYSDQVVVAVNF